MFSCFKDFKEKKNTLKGGSLKSSRNLCMTEECQEGGNRDATINLGGWRGRAGWWLLSGRGFHF